MMMGPEPMSRIDLMSVRLGILFAQLFQEPYEFLCPNNGLAHFLLCQRWRRGKRISIYNVIAGDLLTETPVFVEFVFVFQRTVEQGFKIVNSLELPSFREQETLTIFLDRLLEVIARSFRIIDALSPLCGTNPVDRENP